MWRRFLDVTGFVLAGGLSRRMGQPKAGLTLGSETMLERQLRLLRAVTPRVRVVGPAAGSGGIESVIRSLTPAGVRIVTDELPGRGPLGGIYSALHATPTEFNLFLSCDLPCMEARLLRRLRQRAIETGADVTVAQSRDGRVQPLVAVYRRRALPAVRRSLERGQNRVTSFYRRVHCVILDWAELSRAGFPARVFGNINTPDDYERARRRHGGVPATPDRR